MNGARGEVGLMIGGTERRLCLTLGALAELEAAFGCSRISELEARLRASSAADMQVVLAALLRGGGEAAELARGDAAPGAAAAAIAEAFRRGLGA
ncbi:GTA-gp10 family protein [Hyphomonas sp.]|uniref:GTA-gp10 family protein n=1 Tax=Hyphomonas sp. TaxID=87 RepID=UPI00391DE43A